MIRIFSTRQAALWMILMIIAAICSWTFFTGWGVAASYVGSHVGVYRGGSNLQARPGVEVKVDSSGMVQPGRGLSVNADPAGLEKFGGARQVESVPPELEIVQRGQNPNHFEIASRQAMTLQRFQELLNQVMLK